MPPCKPAADGPVNVPPNRCVCRAIGFKVFQKHEIANFSPNCHVGLDVLMDVLLTLFQISFECTIWPSGPHFITHNLQAQVKQLITIFELTSVAICRIWLGYRDACLLLPPFTLTAQANSRLYKGTYSNHLHWLNDCSIKKGCIAQTWLTVSAKRQKFP